MNTILLHLLPDDAYLCVLQSMEIYEQLSYSLCSKNTKKAIKSLNLRAEQININVVDSIGIEIRVNNLKIYWSSMEHCNYFPDNQAIVHGGIRFILVDDKETETNWTWNFGTWNFENLEFKDWLYHFCEVLHHPIIDHFHFYGENLDDYYIEPIQKIIKGLQVRCFGIWDELTNEFAQQVLKSFPNYEKLLLDQSTFGKDKLNKCLVQNLESFCVPRAERLEIDQVLVSNSVKIQLNTSLLNEKDFNRFMKLWIRGSNPRLKYFVTMGQPQDGSVLLNENAILKGIKRNQIPLDSEEVYGDFMDNYYNYTKLAGGYKIWSFNGTTAVIVLTDCRFEFIVE
ncbi:unnamed protein product [Caenorhabditis brenneri]